MTNDDSATMERMWSDGISTVEIARTIGYTPQYVRQYASAHRDRYPRRRKHVEPHVKADCVKRVLNGEASLKQVAREAGVSYQAVQLWIKGGKW